MRYILYISLIILLLACHSDAPILKVEDPLIEGSITLKSDVISAGEKLLLTGLISEGKKATQLDLIVRHALYIRSYPCTGDFELEIPGEHNQLAGEVMVELTYRGKEIDRKKYFIQPQGAIDKMQNFNGPKDLFADDNDASMNVSIPHDKYDNPLLPPSTVNYQASFEGQIQNAVERPVENLIAYQITPSKIKKGKYLIGSSSSDGFSQEQELIIGAAMPDKFTIELLSFHPFADSRQFIHLKTSVLQDKAQNIVADGTLINFNIKENESLVGSYQAFTIGGIANVYIENPSNAISWSIQASLHDGILSNIIPLSFSKNVNDFEASYNRNNSSIEIGPVVGILGQYAPDGTEVKVSCRNKGLEDYIYLEAGVCSYKLPFDWIQKRPRQIELLIGGHQKIVKLD